MPKVYITVDTEIWCKSWNGLAAQFPQAWQQYVLGRTPEGDYGLEFNCRLLRDHGLTGIFFVEPMFALRFGAAALAEIVGIVQSYGHEAQLHLHTEWVDEATSPPVNVGPGKRRLLSQFALADQTELIRTARSLLIDAGAAPPQAFRAGSFGFNTDTLAALRALDIRIDSSYNATFNTPPPGLHEPARMLTQPMHLGPGTEAPVTEVPVTVFDDGIRGLRHVQLTACTLREITWLIEQADAAGHHHFVLVSHNSELLTRSKQRVDPVVLRRMEGLCRYLADRRDQHPTVGFAAGAPEPAAHQPPPLRSTRLLTAHRMAQQSWRWRYRL